MAESSLAFEGLRGFRLRALSNYWDGILLVLHP